MMERGDLFWFVCGASAARELRARIFAITSASCWCCPTHRAGAAVAVGFFNREMACLSVPVPAAAHAFAPHRAKSKVSASCTDVPAMM